jgi:A/G-specific adenine glycosylase
MAMMDNSDSIAGRILSWYAQNKRDLPWRDTANPYFIWVSEIMLQQTQVETVIPFYQHFLSTFPTVESLAQAPLQEVLKAWENMGYYARARHLHAAAKEITGRMGGKIPSTYEKLVDLPGIGSYTACAILSFAFGERRPAVDGNTRRVVCRLFAIQDLVEHSGTKQKIQELATDMISSVDPAEFNHAVMDLGATVCTPRKPSCVVCPAQDVCLAFEQGMQEVLPVTRKKRPVPHKHMTAAVIADAKGRLLIVQRPNSGLLGGLWKFPGGFKGPEETLEAGLRKRVREGLGIRVEVQEALASVEHAYTHFRITLQAFWCQWRSGKPKALDCQAYQWVRPNHLADYPFSKADRKIIAQLVSCPRNESHNKVSTTHT